MWEKGEETLQKAVKINIIVGIAKLGDFKRFLRLATD